MPNIPAAYTDLPGYKAGFYDLQMVRFALAIADVLTTYGFSTGGGGGGGGNATAANQQTEIDRLTSLLAELQQKTEPADTQLISGSVAVSNVVSVTGAFYQTTQPISAVSLPLPSGAATSANQSTANTSLSSIDGKLPSNLTVSSTRLLVDNSGVTQPVGGNIANAAADSGNPVKIGGVYRATVPTYTDGQRGDARITDRGELVVADQDFVSATINITAADVGSTSSVGADSQVIYAGTPTTSSTAVALVTGQSSFAIQIDGTWVGTLQFERSLDGGLTYTSISAFAAGTAYTRSTTTANGRWHGNCSSSNAIRVRATTWTSGTATIRILAGAGTGTITVGNPIRLYDISTNAQANIALASTAPATTNTALVVTERPEALTPTLNNVTLTSANTEYTISVTSAKRFSFKVLSGGSIRYAYVTGKVAGSTLPYYTLDFSSEESENFGDKTFTGTLYLASSVAGTVVIFKQWS